MFDISWSELLLIGIVALIVIGPKELPGALRTLGQWMAKIRRMASEFQGQFQEAMREAEIDQLKKDMDDMAAKAKDYTNFDPIEDVRRDIEKSVGDLPSLDQPGTATTTTDAAAAETATPPSSPEAAPSSSDALPPPAEQTAATTPVPTTPAPSPAVPEPEPVAADAKPAAGRASA
jgi:sec-independent protein translocase protein TatB